MATFLLSAHGQPAYDPAAIRRMARAILALAVAELVIWIGSALHAYYGSPASLLLPVQVGSAFAATHHGLSTIMPSVAGAYFTGTQGTLLYHPKALSDLFFFYAIGDFTGLDAVFFAGLGLYLYRALGSLATGREFTPAASQTLRGLGTATASMFVLKMLIASAASAIFWTRTQHQFQLLNQHSGSVSYVIFGLLLLLCGEFFRRGQQLQRDSELTI